MPFIGTQPRAAPAKRAALLVRMNDLVRGDGHLIPLTFRYSVKAEGYREAGKRGLPAFDRVARHKSNQGSSLSLSPST
jgi:hypothetical protein